MEIEASGGVVLLPQCYLGVEGPDGEEERDNHQEEGLHYQIKGETRQHPDNSLGH